MTGKLANKVCIVTGAAGGIGLETSWQFAAEGGLVLLADINEERVNEQAEKIKAKFPLSDAFGARVDVTSEAEVASMVKSAVDRWGRLDVMFNNAGIMHPDDKDLHETSERIWNLTHDINVKGVFYGCKHAVTAMRQNKADPEKGLTRGGSVINTSSIVAVVGCAVPQLAYTASKGAVLAMTRELAMVHCLEGIRFNSLCPGGIRTPMLMEFLNTPEKAHRRLVHYPMGRFGEAVEQAKAAVFLASSDASYVNGHDMMVDGGLSRAYVTAQGSPVLDPPTGFTSYTR